MGLESQCATPCANAIESRQPRARNSLATSAFHLTPSIPPVKLSASRRAFVTASIFALLSAPFLRTALGHEGAASVTIVYSFGGLGSADGTGPVSAPIFGIGSFSQNLYGVTTSGGSYGHGTVYEIQNSFTAPTFSFGAFATDKVSPTQPLVVDRLHPDVLWGTTQGSLAPGATDKGSIFQVDLNHPSNVTISYSFGTNGPNDALCPNGMLAQGSDGYFYGTTTQGGDSNMGTIFRFYPTPGFASVLYSFGSTLGEGANPPQQLAVVNASLGREPIGGIYLVGTMQGGGVYSEGTLFEFSPSSGLKVLYNFGSSATDSAFPNGAFLAGSDGKLYGTAKAGGSAGGGTVFSVDPAGVVATVYSFGAKAGDGLAPENGLVQAGNGKLYGLTSSGGRYGRGTIYSVSPSGVEDVIYSFDANTPIDDGSVIRGALTLGDGCLYASTSSGGTHGRGAVYKIQLAPIANDDSAVVANAAPVTINVLANDASPSHFPLSVTSVTHPSLGRVKINADNTITYTPNQSFAKYAGTDHFDYTVSDSFSSATATVAMGNPFYEQKGAFAGSFDADGSGSAGYMTLTLTNAGAFTGKLRLAGGAFYALKGQFDASGKYTALVGGKTLSLQVDTALAGTAHSGSYALAGTYGSKQFSNYHAAYSASNPAPQAGYYTMLLPAVNPTSSSIPSGTGYATLTVSESGAVALAGVLADGAKISDGVYITGSATPFVNQFPVYIPLGYKTVGSLVGSMAFEDVPGMSDCDGSLTWQKPAQTAAGLYKAGFATTLSAVASLYSPPPAGALALDLPIASSNATVTLSEPDFASTLSHDVTLGISPTLPGTDGVTVTSPSADALTMSVKTKSGVFSGTFVNPLTNKATKLQGVLLYKQSIAGGYFLSPTQSGEVSLSGK